MKRFGCHSEEDIQKKQIKYTPDNTIKMNKLAAETLKNYLKEKDMNVDFESHTKEELADILSTFYLDARTKKGELYKTSTLENLRHSLNRYLKAPPVSRDIDIITGQEFNIANESYKTALRELKINGKGATDHYPLITNVDLTRMYMSVHLSPTTPQGLLNRCQMNVRLYFCRRANENMEKMTKGTFKVGQYPNGEKFVYKAEDESTKNHKENDKTLVTGHMPADLVNTDNCPVNNFIKYVGKLNPNNDRLWQYPREVFADTDDVWYQNRPIGRNVLSEFMQRLSKAVPLSTVYTNHSVRVTGATILGKGHSAPQIMAVTGHKASSSLAVYQRVSDEEKRSMGATIRSAINSGEQLALPAPHTRLPLTAPPSIGATIRSATNGKEQLALPAPQTQLPLTATSCQYGPYQNQFPLDRVNPTSRPLSYAAIPGPANSYTSGPYFQNQFPLVATPLDRVNPTSRPLSYAAIPGPSKSYTSGTGVPDLGLTTNQTRAIETVGARSSQEDSELPSDLVDMLFESFDNLPSSNQVNTSSNLTALTRNNAPSFNNCVFHGLTINFNLK